jgi:hypothetical protein
MKNLFLLPTEKPSRLFKFANELHLDTIPKDYYKKYNIYITSDEEIVLNGYHFNSKYGDEPQKTNQRDIDSRKYWEEEDYYISKIILTTDQDLIKDGVQAIDDEFLEWFVENRTCEWIEVVDELNMNGKNGLDRARFIYKIIIPQQEPKQETLEEVAERIRKELVYAPVGIIPNFNDGFELGAKWQQEQDKKSYSEEDMLNFAWFLVKNIGQYSSDKTAHFEGKYLKQFKKK